MTTLRQLLITGFVLTVLVSLFGTVSAQTVDKKKLKEANTVAGNAAKTIDIIQASNSSIPQHILDKAKAVAVFPGVVKVAFGLGGEGGKGLISCRVKNGWSVPAYFRIAGGSAGFQIGASKTDVIMLFMTDKSLRKLMESKVELGAEAGVAAGPVGRTASASTDAQLTAEILSYSKSKGAFAGLSLTGAVLTADNNLNNALYSKGAHDVLMDTDSLVAVVSPSVAGGAFPLALTRHSKH